MRTPWIATASGSPSAAVARSIAPTAEAVPRGHREVVGESAGQVHAEHAQPRAVVIVAREAVAARAARREALDRDAVALLERADARAHARDGARDLVPRARARQDELAVVPVQVGAADPARAHREHDLARARLGPRDLLERRSGPGRARARRASSPSRGPADSGCARPRRCRRAVGPRAPTSCAASRTSSSLLGRALGAVELLDPHVQMAAELERELRDRRLPSGRRPTRSPTTAGPCPRACRDRRAARGASAAGRTCSRAASRTRRRARRSRA